MSQPPLPQLPTQQNQVEEQPQRQPYQPIPFRAPPPLPQAKNKAESIEYPFTIIDSEYAETLFGRQIDVPGYVEWLPSSKLREFVESRELQEGYIKKTYQKDFERIDNNLNEIRAEHKKTAAYLMTRYTELIDKFGVAEADLEKYYKLLTEFEDQKIKMYDTFRHLTRQAVAERYKKRLLEIEKKTEELVECGEVENIKDLLSEYMENRAKWHETKQIINDLETNKILN